MGQKLPSHNALRVASYILKYFEERNMSPTEVEVLFTDGIGIAWSTTKHYMDVEIDNETNAVFSISKNRKNIKFIFGPPENPLALADGMNGGYLTLTLKKLLV